MDKQVVIDLTMSDDELEVTNSRIIPNLSLPDPSNPVHRRRLTAAECLRADRIAYDEINLVTGSYTLAPSSQPLSRATRLVCDSTVPVIDDQSEKSGCLKALDEASTATRAYPSQSESFELDDATFHQRCGNERPSQRGFPNHISNDRERGRVPRSIYPCSKGYDSSDHESVLYPEEDSIGLTTFKDTPELPELMASGRPRRACAPRSFKRPILKSAFHLEEDSTALTTFEGTPQVAEMMSSGRPRRACAPRSFTGLMENSTFGCGGADNAEERRAADLIERVVIAHRELWENRLVAGFTHSCGSIGDVNARAAMKKIAKSFGARGRVENRAESGKTVKRFVMRQGKRLRSPSDVNTRERARHIMHRLGVFGDLLYMPQLVNDDTTIQTETRCLERKDRMEEDGNETVEVAKESERGPEFEREVKKDESAFENEEVDNIRERRAELIERAVVAHRELWKNRDVSGFTHSCGRIDDGNARAAMIQIGHSFGANSKVRKRAENGKGARYVVMRRSKKLRSPSDMNTRERAATIMHRLCVFGDLRYMPQSVNDDASIQIETRYPERKDRTEENGSETVEVAKKPEGGPEFERKLKEYECALQNGEVGTTRERRAELIERAVDAHREMWKNRDVKGFSYSCGRIDDKTARTAMMQIAQSFGAKVKVDVRTESGKKVRYFIVKWSSKLRSPSDMNTREKAGIIMSRRCVFGDLLDREDPRDSTQDNTTNNVQHACTTEETPRPDNAAKRKLSSQKGTARAQGQDARRAIFQGKRQRQLEGTKIESTNKGFSLLTKMGWTVGTSLGANKNGISEPVVAQFRMGRGGIGTK